MGFLPFTELIIGVLNMIKIKKLFQKLTCKEKGKKAEDLAASYLHSKGFKIPERNFKTSFGEIDIIAKKKLTLVFVEVKSEFSKNEFFAKVKVDFRKKEKSLRLPKVFT